MSSNNQDWNLRLGANFIAEKLVEFKVWAPFCNEVKVEFKNDTEKSFNLKKDDSGYFTGTIEGLSEGEEYFYLLDNEKKRADPVSRFLPAGVEGPTSLINPASYQWHDQNWQGIELKKYIIYEIHISTFTDQGTFEALISKLPYLKELGVNCLEIMPIAQFPGKRNWGYDGVSLYAVQNSYGGPIAFKKFIDAAHNAGFAVCLDVIYNHFGPEGNFLHDFGPYFTNKYSTPWGDAINYDAEFSTEIRNFVIQNALYWIHEYHIDALRLDAIHAICDFSAIHILEEIKAEINQQTVNFNKPIYLIAESDLNDTRIIKANEQGGFNLDAQWSDDFHHSVHALVTKEKQGYYSDFGNLKDLAKVIKDRFVYDGIYSNFRKRRHGNKANSLSGDKFVVSIQNHDQIGNRAYGDRLSKLVSLEDQKLAAALLILSPYIPLLFMGQEYGETNPFQYFIEHDNADLIKAIQEGRKREFKACGFDTIPDPYDRKTFENSKLNWDLYLKEPHQELFKLYKDLITLRKTYFTDNVFDPKNIEVNYDEKEQWLEIKYAIKIDTMLIISFSFASKALSVKIQAANSNLQEILNINNEN